MSGSDQIFRVVTDPMSQPEWRSDLLEVHDDGYGQWTETPKKGDPISFTEIRREAPHLYEIRFTSQGFAGIWVGTFEPVPDGTRISFTETIAISNPISRVIARAFSLAETFMDNYLASLQRRMAKS